MLTFASSCAGLAVRRSTPRTAVFTIAERMSAADQSGCSPRRKAAVPARCGVAIEVPWKNAKHGGVAQNACGIDESTFTPGATTSGFTRKSTSVGPWLLKDAMMSELGVVKYCCTAAMVVVVPPTARSACPSTSETPYAGMVGWFAVPSVAIAAPSPPMLFATSTAAAPAAWALRIFVEKLHAPRETSAICPVRLVASAEHAVESPFVVPATTASGAVRSAVTVAKSPAMPGYVDPAAVMGVPTRCPTLAAPAANALLPEPGDSTVKRPGPELPAATAT